MRFWWPIGFLFGSAGAEVRGRQLHRVDTLAALKKLPSHAAQPSRGGHPAARRLVTGAFALERNIGITGNNDVFRNVMEKIFPLFR